ncbi:glycosyl transferase, partial [Cladochytrium tenue]
EPTKLLVFALYALLAHQALTLGLTGAAAGRRRERSMPAKKDGDETAAAAAAALPRKHEEAEIGLGLSPIEAAYLWGLVGVQAYADVVHGWLAGPGGRLEFLPLMLTSVYCAVGVVYAWARLLALTLAGGGGSAGRVRGTVS